MLESTPQKGKLSADYDQSNQSEKGIDLSINQFRRAPESGMASKRSITLDRSKRLLDESLTGANLVPIKMNLSKELKDPGNSSVMTELQKLIHLNTNLNSALQDFEEIKRSRSFDDKCFENLSKIDQELSKKKYKYSCKFKIIFRYFLPKRP
jgi:hypothetical protein